MKQTTHLQLERADFSQLATSRSLVIGTGNSVVHLTADPPMREALERMLAEGGSKPLASKRCPQCKRAMPGHHTRSCRKNKQEVAARRNGKV